jgi:hypothetical protein
MCRHVADVHVDDHQVRVVEPSWEELVDIPDEAAFGTQALYRLGSAVNGLTPSRDPLLPNQVTRTPCKGGR